MFNRGRDQRPCKRVILVKNIRGALRTVMYTHELGFIAGPGFTEAGVSVTARLGGPDCVANAVVRLGPTLFKPSPTAPPISGSDRGGYQTSAGSEQFLDPDSREGG